MEISVENNGCYFNFSFPRGKGKTAFEKNVDKIFSEQPKVGGLTIDEIVIEELQKLLFVEPEPISYSDRYSLMRKAIAPSPPSFIYSSKFIHVFNEKAQITKKS